MNHAPAPLIYPAYTFSASPTFNKWVKLTAVDVHALRHVTGFEGRSRDFCVGFIAMPADLKREQDKTSTFT